MPVARFSICAVQQASEEFAAERRIGVPSGHDDGLADWSRWARATSGSMSALSEAWRAARYSWNVR